MTVLDLSAQTGQLAATPNPWGTPSGPGLWGHEGWKLPNYVEQVSKGIMKSGRAKTESEAIHMALGVLAHWARGGGKVSPEVRAAAAAAIAEFNALKAKAAASHSHSNEGAAVTATVDLAFSEALHPRVPAGGAGGGQFGSAAAGASKTPPAKTPPAKGKPAAKQAKPAPQKAPVKKPAAKKPAAKKPPVKPSASLQANHVKAAQLHAEAKADRAKAHALLQQVSAINKQIHANQVAAAKAAKAAKAKGHKAGTVAGKAVAKKAPAKAGKKAGKKAKRVTTAQLKAKRATLRTQAAGLMAKAKALDAQASHLKLAGDSPAVELAVKTPAPERAAGRAKLAAEGNALPGGEEPIPDLVYLKKAIRSVGRLDPSKRPALKALIIKRARELNAMDEPGVKGTWAFEAANDGPAVELAMSRTAKVRGPGDVSCKRTAPGEVTVTHKPTGRRIGTLKSAQHGGWSGTHATGKPSPPSGSMTGALSGLIGLHNKVMSSMPSTSEPMPAVQAHAASEAALELAGALPYTSGVTSSDGPRVTSVGGGKTALAPAAHAVYRKLRAKGMKHGQALALAKRAAAMRAKTAAA